MARSKVLLAALLITTALLKMCSVSDPIQLHVHPALKIKPTVLHSLNMHRRKNGISFPIPLYMLFLPDNHILDTNITFVNIDGLTLRGESASGNSATIICNRSASQV